jgi:hypothetical protein
MMNINDIYVSACRGAFDRNVYDVRLIDWLENVRPQIPLNDYAKKQLPAIMPHGLFETRRQDTFKQHSGLVQIDIDGKHQGKDFDLNDLKAYVQDRQYDCIVASGVSCSGSGLYMLVAVKDINRDNHAMAAARLSDWAEDQFGVVCDDPVSTNLSSLRFASPYTPYINFDVEPIDCKL